ncbi:MAG TPA: hypothetical protein VMT52_15295 [Planctomycetota bacterium]|nr:hypothetical protein [Planctomycetota bacterium]
MRVGFKCLLRGLIPALSVSCVILGSPVLHAAELDDLISQYEAAKKEWQASRRPGQAGPGGGGRRGGGGRGGPGRQRPPELEPILSSIARLNTDASFGFLTKEYGDADPEIASRCGAAMLESDHKRAVQLVIRGFDRGGAWTPGARVRVLDALARARGDEASEFVIRLASRENDAVRAFAQNPKA